MGWARGKLLAMQQTTATAPSPTSQSFAGLLAALTAPEQGPGAGGDSSFHAVKRASTAWIDDGLEDDIATLSYERALKTHARYRINEHSMAQGPDSLPAGLEQPLAADSESDTMPATRPSAEQKRPERLDPLTNQSPEENRFRSTPCERSLKSASITIRMSKVECAQLHRRAADAGLSVSAYLRSCTFEAESLRAMVKDTLSELRLAKAQSKPPTPEPPRSSAPHSSRIRGATGWMVQMLTPWNAGRRVANA